MKAFLFVLFATIVEAAGDAVIRVALHSGSGCARVVFFLFGVILLAAYGTSLNLAPVEFSTVTGMYVALLFVMFQLMNYLFFRVTPTPATVIGGLFILTGGTIVYSFR